LSPQRYLAARPALAAVLGASAIASSGIFVRLSDASPSTVAVFRCAYALPALALLALYERRRYGIRSRRGRIVALVAGIAFAADLILWHHAIAAVGAGLATVLGNLQVVVVGLAAWMLFGERVPVRMILAIPLALIGVVLISGMLEDGAFGRDPPLGVFYGVLTSLCYAAFILLLRHAGTDIRRPAGPLLDVSITAAVAAALFGWAVGEFEAAPEWPAHGWLVALALTAQVLGWLLISVSLARLPAALTSVILLLQPVGAVLLSMVILEESPSTLQLFGVAVVLAAVVAATMRRKVIPAPPLPATDAELQAGVHLEIGSQPHVPVLEDARDQ
jgi:drug/metabolite transporter (DMT)-like permease